MAGNIGRGPTAFNGTGCSSFGETLYGGPINSAGPKYFVSRNVAASGDGKSWNTAFKTITEGIAALNAAYIAGITPSAGRNAVLYIGEGYYSEVPISLTASDAYIVCTAPGGHDSTVFYGSGAAGSWAGTTTAPAITITGDNNTIYGLGVVNRSGGLQPAIQIADGALANKLINCKITKDAVDSSLYGIEDLGNAYTEIIGCEFSVSCKTAGIRLYSATNNGIQQLIKDCRFYGIPAGVLIDAAAHDAIIENCIFLDDDSDTDDICDTPILNNGGSSLIVRECYSLKSTANLVTGAGTSYEANTFQLA